MLYTVPVAIDPLDVAAAAVVTQILSTRLSDDIREELGESYSPFATVSIYGDRSRWSRRTRVGDRRTRSDRRDLAVRARRRRRAPRRWTFGGEFDTAVEQVRRDIELFAYAQLIDEILTAEVDGADGVDELGGFADQGATLQRLRIDDVRAFVARYLPADQYIEITVLPR